MNPREVENLEKEIVILKRQRASHDERILQLWEELPPAKEASAEVQKRIEVKKGELAGLRKLAMGEKEKLEAEFKRLSAMRPEATKNISPTLLVRYDAIRQKQSGEGMAEVKKPNTCLGCGTFIPERTMDALKNDRVATCESCHRILYYTEGITA